MFLSVTPTPKINCYYHATLIRKILKTFEVGNSQQCKRLQLEIIMVHFARLGCEGCPEGCEYSNIQGLTSLTLCARRDALLYSSSDRLLQVGLHHFPIRGGNDSQVGKPLKICAIVTPGVHLKIVLFSVALYGAAIA